MPEGWKSTDEPPDWRDGGPAELRYADGCVVSGRLAIVDTLTEGDEEIPVFEFTSDAGAAVSFFDAQEWRLKPEAHRL